MACSGVIAFRDLARCTLGRQTGNFRVIHPGLLCVGPGQSSSTRVPSERVPILAGQPAHCRGVGHGVGSPGAVVVRARPVSALCYEMARSLRMAPQTTLLAIGNFDGVHRGHQQILCAAAREARVRSLEPVVLSFFPHPATVLNKGDVPLLTDISRRCQLIKSIDSGLRFVVEPFTLQLAAYSPERFVRELLVGGLGARLVTVGHNFRFGRGRSGDLGTLQELGQQMGFEVAPHAIAGDNEGPFSSSRARQALAVGDLDAFQRVVGRPHALTGRVVVGDRRGRTLGAPTANLEDVAEALPARGVYAGLAARVEEQSEVILGPAAVNIGARPTFGAGSISTEAHIVGFTGDLYGQTLRLHLTTRLRPERRFSSVEELRQQIHRDIVRAAEVSDLEMLAVASAPCDC